MKKVIFKIEKIKDREKQEQIEDTLEKNSNIKDATIEENTIEITYKDLTINKIEELIEKEGCTSYGVELVKNVKKKSKVLLSILGAILTIILYFSFAIKFKLPLYDIFDTKTMAIILSVITLFFIIYGMNILVDGIKSIINGRAKLNGLLALTIIITFIYGIVNLIFVLGRNNNYDDFVYFEIIIFLIYFKKLGNYLVNSNEERITNEIKQISNTSIKKANVKVNGKVKEVNIESIKVNEQIICYPGDKVLLDGTVTKGYSHTAEALINGRSLPIEKEENTIVLSGSMNCESELEYTVDRIHKDSYVANIKKLIAEEKNNKKIKYKKVDRACSYILPICIIVSIIAGILYYIITKNINDSFNKFITTLIIFSPFGLAIASPLSFRKIVKTTPQKGLLIKNTESLEDIKNIDTIVLDKTGTLTRGYLSISRINNHSEMTDKELLELLGSVEKHSTHALARGINKYLREEKIKASYDLITEDLIGYGVKGKDNDNLYYACNSELLKKLDIINSYKEEERKMRLDGNDVIYLTKNNKIIATFGLKDTLKKETIKVINSLKEKKYNIIMLSGDDAKISEKVGKELGISKVVAELNPMEKCDYVKKLMKKGHKVLVVGDGLNDALMIATADVGVAIKNSLDVPTAASDIIITNNNLFKILDLMNLSKHTTRLVSQNIRLSLLFTFILLVINTGIIPKIKISSLIIIVGFLLSFIVVLLNTRRVRNK